MKVDIIEKTFDKANQLFHKANIYFENGEYKKAIKCYFKSIKKYQESKESENIYAGTYNIGNCYYYLGDYDEALVYFNKSVLYENLAEESKEKIEKCHKLEYLRLFNRAYKAKTYHEAYIKCNRVIKYCEKVHDFIGVKKGKELLHKIEYNEAKRIVNEAVCVEDLERAVKLFKAAESEESAKEIQKDIDVLKMEKFKK